MHIGVSRYRHVPELGQAELSPWDIELLALVLDDAHELGNSLAKPVSVTVLFYDVLAHPVFADVGFAHFGQRDARNEGLFHE